MGGLALRSNYCFCSLDQVVEHTELAPAGGPCAQINKQTDGGWDCLIAKHAPGEAAGFTSSRGSGNIWIEGAMSSEFTFLSCAGAAVTARRCCSSRCCCSGGARPSFADSLPASALRSEKLREKEIETKTANNNAKLRAKSDERKWKARGGDRRDGNEAPRREAALSV
jgi:hypothetical protein